MGVRAAVLTHLKRYADRCRPLHDGYKPQKEIATCDWKEYLELLASATAWGGGLELYAASQCFNRAIIVISDDLPIQVYSPTGKDTADMATRVCQDRWVVTIQLDCPSDQRS